MASTWGAAEPPAAFQIASVPTFRVVESRLAAGRTRDDSRCRRRLRGLVERERHAGAGVPDVVAMVHARIPRKAVGPPDIRDQRRVSRHLDSPRGAWQERAASVQRLRSHAAPGYARPPGSGERPRASSKQTVCYDLSTCDLTEGVCFNASRRPAEQEGACACEMGARERSTSGRRERSGPRRTPHSRR